VPDPPTRSDTDVVGRRVVAQSIDSIAMVVAFLLINALTGFGAGMIFVLSELPWGDGGGAFSAVNSIGTFASIFAFFGYNFILETAWAGQTVGKRRLGVRVVKENGTLLDAKAAFIRNLPIVVSFAVIDYILPYLMLANLVALLSAITSDRRQRLFDRVAGTVVVTEEFGERQLDDSSG
jgi:uncharacterized RDD family membrane protein YckC